jgi:hypothetical protein
MNVFQNLFAKRKFSKAEANAKKISSEIEPFLNVIGVFAAPLLHDHVPSWSLSNKVLLNYLGYVAGVVDAAEYCIFGENRTGNLLASEATFYQVVQGQLDWIPGVEIFLAGHDAAFELGHPNAIGGMQLLPGFIEAMKLGADDYLSMLPGSPSPSSVPVGLHKLGLFLAATTEADGKGSIDPVLEDYLSEENIFDRSQDHKLSDIGFFRKECLAQIYGHCIVKDRNIRDSDFVTIGTRFINVWDSSEKSDTGHSTDEMMVSCSEPIIARCLIKNGGIDFENCSEVADNIAKYLIFSRSRDGALMLFKLIRMANLVAPTLSDEKDMFDYFSTNRELEQQVLKIMAHAQEIDMQKVERIETEGW